MQYSVDMQIAKAILGCRIILSQNLNVSDINQVKIGEPVLTKFERARIIGARALQISQGAPVLIQVEHDDFRPIDVARKELKSRVLPIGLARRLPNSIVPDTIPIQWLEDREFISQIKEDKITTKPGVKKASPKKASPKKASPKKASPKKASPKKASPKKAKKSTKKDIPLTKISGVGTKKADDFVVAGFNTVSDIVNASITDLTKVSGIGKATAEKIQNNAKKIVN